MTVIFTTASACLLSLPPLTFNLSSLGTIIAVDSDGFSYIASPCHPSPHLPAFAAGCTVPALHGALAFQLHRGQECYALSDRGRQRTAGPLGGGRLGFQVALRGGGVCGELRRSLTLEVECGGEATTPPTAGPSGEGCGQYAMALHSPAGCPLQCGRDAAGGVCGGAAHGACKMSDSGGGVACACAVGYSGPLCEAAPNGASGYVSLPLSRLLLAAAAGAVAAFFLLQQFNTCSAAGGCDGGIKATATPAEPPCGYFTVWARLVAIFMSLSILAVIALPPNADSGDGVQASISAMLDAPLQTWAISALSGPPPLSAAALLPLLVVYGDLPLYFGSYSVKHFIVTANALKEERGWEEYVPTSNDPRDSWEVMEARCLAEFGRMPDVMLLLSDVGLTGNPDRLEGFQRSAFNTTQILDWYDDMSRGGVGSGMAQALRGVSVLLPTYEYLTHWRVPLVAGLPRVWMPHSALPAFFSQPFANAPEAIVLLVGMVTTGYPMREEVANRISQGDPRFRQWEHPGWQAGPSMQHIGDFAAVMAGHIACILDGSMHNFVVAKVFEVPATGSLLLMSDDVADALAALGLVSGVHYLSFNRSSLDAVVDWVLNPSNRLAVDGIRAAGRKVVISRHTTQHRVDAIHALALEAARVKRDKRGIWDADSLAAVTSFPVYKDWAWKDATSAEYYSEQREYRRARLLEEAEGIAEETEVASQGKRGRAEKNGEGGPNEQ